MRIHHIGIATKNIDEEILNIKKFHHVLDVSDIIFDEEQKTYLCLIKTEEGINFELINGEPVENLIARGITFYHTCFETDQFERELQELINKGAILISSPKPAALFNNRKVAFVFLPYGTIELLEEE